MLHAHFKVVFCLDKPTYSREPSLRSWMDNQYIPPKLVRFFCFPYYFWYACLLSEGNHCLPCATVFRSLDNEGYTRFVLAHNFASTNWQGYFKFTLNKFAYSAWIKVKSITFSNFKVMFVKMVRIISYFSNFITNFGILWIVIPRG